MRAILDEVKERDLVPISSQIVLALHANYADRLAAPEPKPKKRGKPGTIG